MSAVGSYAAARDAVPEWQTYARVVVDVAEEHRVSPEDIAGRSRLAHVVRARHEVWRRMRDRGWSYPAIARAARVDHTSVQSAVKSFKPRLVVNHARPMLPAEPAPSSYAAGYEAGKAEALAEVVAYLRRSCPASFPRDHRHADVVERRGHERR